MFYTYGQIWIFDIYMYSLARIIGGNMHWQVLILDMYKHTWIFDVCIHGQAEYEWLQKKYN